MSRKIIIGENSIEYIKVLLDIWNNGDCAVLIDWRTPPVEVKNIIDKYQIDSCYIDSALKEKFYDVIIDKNKKIFYQSTCSYTRIIPSNIYADFKPNYSNEEALILFSSGTTGKSKGIVLSFFAINTNCDMIIDYMQPTEKDSIYILKTFSHSSTLVGEILVALKSKIRALISPNIGSMNFIFSNIEKYGISIMCVNPSILALMNKNLKGPLNNLKKIYVSGETLPKRLLSDAKKNLNVPIFNVYGLSEAGPRVSAQNEKSHGNSVGCPLKNVEIKIMKNNKIVPIREVGTIYVKTPSLFCYYLSDPQGKNNKEWFNTQDIGYIDENNELHILGREGGFAIINSHKIYMPDIENRIMQLNGVNECCVFLYSNEKSKMLCCAYSGEISPQEIKTNLQSMTVYYEIPKKYLKLEKIPRNVNGKISINSLCKIIQNM